MSGTVLLSPFESATRRAWPTVREYLSGQWALVATHLFRLNWNSPTCADPLPS
jgi:hypothetical protein